VLNVTLFMIIAIPSIKESFWAKAALVRTLAFVHSYVRLKSLRFMCSERTSLLIAFILRFLLQVKDFNMKPDSLSGTEGL
jgi:hypothetical protein